jgi:hypothetical protein
LTCDERLNSVRIISCRWTRQVVMSWPASIWPVLPGIIVAVAPGGRQCLWINVVSEPESNKNQKGGTE